MARIQIPLTGASDFQRSIVQFELEDQKYRFRTYWIERSISWFCDFGTLDRWIIQGVRLAVDGVLFDGIQDEAMPTGQFEVKDLSGEQKEAEYTDLGDIVVVQYIPLDDLAVDDSEGESYVVT